MYTKLIAFVVFLLAASSLHAQTATINWTITHQTIDGFGAADANNGGTNQEMTTPQLQFFFGTGAGQLGFSILRTRIPNNSTGPDAGNCSTVNGAGCVGTQTTDYAYAVANGIRIYGTPWSPPAAYKSSGTTQCGSLLAGSYANFATWISNWVQSWKSTYNVYPYAMSVQNEPDECGAFTSASYSAAQFDSFIGTNLGPSFSGLPTLIFFPEVENSGSLTSYGGTCMSDSTCAAFIGGVNFHDYHVTLTAPDTVSAVPYPATFPATSHYWETEASCPGSNNFCTSTWTPTIANALQWAAVIDQRIAVDNMNAWLWWWFLQDATAPDQEGLMDINTGNAVALRAYAIGQYARFIRPGYIRVDATHQPQTGVSVSAYQGPSNALTIVATNYTASPINQTFNIANAPTFSTLSAYRTSATESIASVTAPSVSGNSFTYSLPAQSITTFTGVGTGGGGGNTINEPDCSLATWQGISGQIASLTGAVTVNFPMCSNTWSGSIGSATAVTVTQPSAVTSLTLQGQSVVTCTNTPGTATYVCSSVDNSAITDSIVSTANQHILITTGAANAAFRMTGLSFLGGTNTGNQTNAADIVFQGSSHSFRIDHNNFQFNTYTAGQDVQMRMYGDINGVVDHNLITTGFDQEAINQFNPGPGGANTYSNEDASWNTPTSATWGTSANLFMESNYLPGAGGPDISNCYDGGRAVVRYNTVPANSNNVTATLVVHQTGGGSGRDRGCRSMEAYGNYFGTSVTANESAIAVGGAEVIWNNTINNYNHVASSNIVRSDSDTAHGGNPPGGGPITPVPSPNYGKCGNTTNPGTAWDGKFTATTGYPCLDQPGRGQSDLLNGQAFACSPCYPTVPNAGTEPLDTVTSTQKWPTQMYEPVYMWGNVQTGTGIESIWINNTGDVSANRDVFFDNLSCEPNGCSSLATGTGIGTLAQRPATCTAGPGGAFFTSPVGSYGVAYFATDQNGGRGVLYVCTALTTWTQIYTPYQYPHPLVTGSPTIGVSFSPTSLNFGSVSLGTTSSPQTITVTNIGTGNLIFGPTGTTNPTGSSFNAAGGTCPISGTLTPSSTCTVILQVTANSGSGVMNGTFNFPSNAPGSPQTVPLTVTVVASALSFSPASMNFGSLPLYTTTAPTQGTLTNTGSATLTISSVTTTGIFALAAPMSAPDCRTVGTLAIGASCNFAVSVTPAVAGVATGSVVFVDNAPGQPQSFPLTVTGLQVAPAPTPSFAMAANLAGCKQANPPAPTWCLTGDGHIYFSGCGVATCGPFVPFGLTVAGTAQ